MTVFMSPIVFININENDVCLVAVGMIFDQPYGLKHETWDMEAPSVEDLTLLFKQINAINKSDFMCACLFAHWDKLSIPRDALLASGFKDIQCVVWYKNDITIVSAPDRYTPACEHIIVGRLKSEAKSQNICMLDEDPRRRHSIIQGPRLLQCSLVVI